MLNQVLIEGYISGRPWKYDGKQYFRLGSYRDEHRPAKRDPKENRDEPDYVTVQMLPQGVPISIEMGARVRVQGFLQSRYAEETLDQWLKSAKGPKNTFTASSDYRRELRHSRVITEIVCETLIVVEPPKLRQVQPPAPAEPASKTAVKPNGHVSEAAPASTADPVSA